MENYSVVISIISLVISGYVAKKQHNLNKKSFIQNEYKEKKKVVLSVINLITKGSKYEFNDETLESFWEDAVVGRYLFDEKTTEFITLVGNKYSTALECYKKNPNTDDFTVDTIGHWFWHQREEVHKKFDKYFSNK